MCRILRNFLIFVEKKECRINMCHNILKNAPYMPFFTECCFFVFSYLYCLPRMPLWNSNIKYVVKNGGKCLVNVDLVFFFSSFNMIPDVIVKWCLVYAACVFFWNYICFFRNYICLSSSKIYSFLVIYMYKDPYILLCFSYYIMAGKSVNVVFSAK